MAMNFYGKELIRRKEVAAKAAKEAGKMLKNNFGKVSDIKIKSDRNLVTDIDFKADKIIIDKIKKYFKEDNIISEESSLPKPEADYTWIIDPLDGTHNYIHNIDIFGVSIAVAFKDKSVIGAIYMPLTDQLYLAEEGKGSFCNGRKIRVSDRELNKATLIYDSNIRLDKENMLKNLSNLTDKVFNIRMFGCTARSLSYIAEGRAEVEVEYSDEVWDYAAGLLLVEEAGGLATDLEGKKWNIKTKGYIASNRKIHQEILKIINSV
jgi:myo-inositol-1(or 4)-monophosphatase